MVEPCNPGLENMENMEKMENNNQMTQNILVMIHNQPDKMISDVPWMFSDVP